MALAFVLNVSVDRRARVSLIDLITVGFRGAYGFIEISRMINGDAIVIVC